MEKPGGWILPSGVKWANSSLCISQSDTPFTPTALELEIVHTCYYYNTNTALKKVAMTLQLEVKWNLSTSQYIILDGLAVNNEIGPLFPFIGFH